MAEVIKKKLVCDYCEKEISRSVNKFEVVTGHVGQGTDIHTCKVYIALNGVIPYGTGDAHMCRDCAVKFLKRAVTL